MTPDKSEPDYENDTPHLGHVTVGQVLMVDLPEEASLIVLVHFRSVSASGCARGSAHVFHPWTGKDTAEILCRDTALL